MSRRVAFTGAQGVGKTTLVAAVREKLGTRSAVAVLEGLGASVAELGVPVGEGATAEDADGVCRTTFETRAACSVC